MGIYYLIAFVGLALDQVSKWMVVHYMKIGESIPLIQDTFQLTSHRNKGAAFGILQNQRIIFIVVGLVVSITIPYLLSKAGSQQKMRAVALSFILGGALGNLIDRTRNGQVVDMFDFTLIQFPIFNVADSLIVLGVGFLLVTALREGVE